MLRAGVVVKCRHSGNSAGEARVLVLAPPGQEVSPGRAGILWSDHLDAPCLHALDCAAAVRWVSNSVSSLPHLNMGMNTVPPLQACGKEQTRQRSWRTRNCGENVVNALCPVRKRPLSFLGFFIYATRIGTRTPKGSFEFLFVNTCRALSTVTETGSVSSAG